MVKSCGLNTHTIRTKEAYIHWIKRFILFHHKRPPRDTNLPANQQSTEMGATSAPVARSCVSSLRPRCSLWLWQQIGIRSPGFSRTRRSRQCTAAPASIPPASAGTPVIAWFGLFAQPSAAGSGIPGSVRLPWQVFHRLKPGLP